ADPGTPLFTEMWTPFLKDFVVHLREKGWLGITNIAMDERSPETMAHIIKVMRSAAPELGIALADNHASYKKYPDVRDICVGINHQHADRADIEARRARGLVTTYYVCCSSAWPNTFTFSDPAEATYHAWLAVARDYDGFLRWAVQSWNEDPERDSRFRTWPAGDTYMIYPGARSSMRFELLRQGVQDAEKIRILRAEFAADASPEALGKLGTLEELVAPFAADTPVEGWKSSLHSARALLNEL
ncbi:MAG: DUF4091 domain-containing protein, partial [Rikenellaceae bacterium]|nr:DUF4091 domain-containing protein [Rikenellaceae bacterium]